MRARWRRAFVLSIGLALIASSVALSSSAGTPGAPTSAGAGPGDRSGAGSSGGPSRNPNQLALARSDRGAAAAMTVRDAAYPDSAIISNGVVQLGINPAGNLNVYGGEPSSGGTPAVGLRYVPTNADATAPGCLCEGWGVAAGPGPDPHAGTSGYANEDTDFGANNLEVVEFSNTADSARSVVDVLGDGGAPVMRVTHDYEPFPGSPNLYRAAVTVENLTGSPIGDLLYRRVMDWDVEPTAFQEYVTIDGDESSDFLRYSSDDGFASANPLAGPSTFGSEGFFTDAGPTDQGALFDFGFGALPPLESRSFTVFYGAAGTEADAIDAVAAAQAEIWSLGQPSTPDGQTLGTPNTFVFGFSGVGGAGAGADARPPVTLATSAPTRLPVGERELEVTARLDNTSDADIPDGSVRIDPGAGLTVIEGANPAALGTLEANATGDGPSSSWRLRTPAPSCASDRTFEYDVYGDFAGSGSEGGERHVHRSITVPRSCGTVRGTVTWTTGDTGGTEAGARISVCPTGTGGDCQAGSAAGDGQYSFSSLTPGEYTIDARPNPSGPRADLPPQRKTVSVSAGGTVTQNFQLTSLAAPPADGSVEVGSPGGGTTDDGFPLVFWNDPLELTTTPPAPCDGATVTYSIVQGDPIVVTLASGPMAEGPPGTFKAVAPPLFPNVGYAKVTFEIDCPGGSDPEPIEFNIYIDPSGFVRTVSGDPIPGAKVTLLRSDAEDGPFSVVPDGSTIMSPSNRTNPDTTNSAGHFGWDVIAGYYVVRAEKAGCHAPGDAGSASVESRVYEIPPPVTDVDLRLECPSRGSGGGDGGRGGGGQPRRSGPAPTPSAPRDATPARPCAGLRGARRRVCAHRRTLLAKCDRSKGRRRGICRKRAVALAKCERSKGRKRAICRKRAVALAKCTRLESAKRRTCRRRAKALVKCQRGSAGRKARAKCIRKAKRIGRRAPRKRGR